MSVNILAALTIFGLGCLVLLAWLYVTSENPRSLAILRKAAIYIALPSIVAGLLHVGIIGVAWVGMAVGVLVEELIKLVASRSEAEPNNAFALATLFGVFELLFWKPLMALSDPKTVAETGAAMVAVFSLAPVLMHALTAMIYAYHGRTRPVFQVALCWVVHFLFNGLAAQSQPLVFAALSSAACVVAMVVLWPGDLKIANLLRPASNVR